MITLYSILELDLFLDLSGGDAAADDGIALEERD